MSNYLQQRNIFRHRLRSRLIVVVAVVMFLSLLYVIAPNFWGGILREAGKPLWGTRNVLSTELSEYLDLLRSKRSLVAMNRALEDRLDKNTIALLDRSLILSDNRRLLGLLGRDEDKVFLVARVLATPKQSPYDTLVLDIGSESGIELGNIVFVEGEIPVGYISVVNARSSLATLYSSPGEKVNAFLGTDTVPVVLDGRGGGNFLLSLPRDNENRKGDIAFLPEYPTDVLAVVEQIETERSNPFATLRLRSPVNMHNVTLVEVITSSP